MRIEAVFVILVRQKQVTRQAFGDGQHVSAAGKIFEELFHLRFEIKAMPQNDIRPRRCHDVRPGLTVRMGIDARPHKRLDRNDFSTHHASRIGDHAGRGDDADLVLRLQGHRPQGSCEEERR